MDFRDVVASTGACRYYKPDPVAADVLARVLDAARYAASGGNRQPVRLVAVCDAKKRRALAALYLPLWEAYSRGGQKAREALPEGPAKAAATRMLEGADHMARQLHEVPVLIVVCARIADLYATDAGLGRLSVVGGASIYPAVQNLMLAARAEGLGTALTTLLCAREAKVKELLGIPEDFLTAALLPLGHPAMPIPRKLRRRPLADVAFLDGWGRGIVA